MKKFIISTATILVLLLSVFSLFACSKIPENHKDVRSNLRRNGYDVLISSDSEEAVDLAYDLLSGCIYSLDDEDSIEDGELLLLSFEEDYNQLVKDINVCVAGKSENGKGEDLLIVIYFDDSQALETHYDIFIDVFDLIIANTFNADEFPIDNSELKYSKTKNILYFGTEQAIKDAN